jgi:hypothetical protein
MAEKNPDAMIQSLSAVYQREFSSPIDEPPFRSHASRKNQQEPEKKSKTG